MVDIFSQKLIPWTHKVLNKFKVTNKQKLTPYNTKHGVFYNPNEGEVTFDSSWEEIRFKLLTRYNVRWYRNHKVKIPYISPKDNQTHYYIPDIYIVTPKQIVIEEIKPSSQLNDPVVKAKKEAAIKFCSFHGMKYKIITEKELLKIDEGYLFKGGEQK